MEDWTIQKLLLATQIYLTKKGADGPRLLSEVLLAHTLGVDRVYLFSHFDQPIGESERARYRQAILRCAKGEPVAYITGEKEFMSLRFRVTPATLIPRPDTEILVETALQLIQKHGYRRLCDVGTGSGCIPISIAHYTPTPLTLTAIDLSQEALAIAQENAARHQVNIRFLQGNLLAPLHREKHSFDLITANLPYVPRDIYRTLDRGVKDFEPRMALTDEQDGLSLYRRLVRQAQTFLNATGRMLLEIDPRQSDQLDFLVEAGFDYTIIPDLAGRNRVVCAKRKGLPEELPLPPTTQHLVVDPQKPDLSQLAKAATLLQQGGLVAFPTETVYGLGASYQDPYALAEIFKVKGRPQESPLLVAISNREQLKDLVTEIPPAAELLMDHFWPGPLSIILPAKPELPAAIKSPTGGIGIRMPANRVALELIRLSGPISAPSANVHGRPSPTEGHHVFADLDGKIPAVLDAGRTPGGVESTIVDCTQTPVRILRLGAIPQEAIATVLGQEVASAVPPPAHYDLTFQVFSCANEAIFARKKEILQHFGRPYGVLSFTIPDDDPQARWCGCFTPQSQPADWFALLREAESAGIQALLVHPFEPHKPHFPEGLQVRMERVFKND